MFLKNVSFEMVVAVKENTKDMMTFQPQEIIEVSDADGAWFMQRYNDTKVYFRPVTETVATVAAETNEVATVETPVKESFVCQICGMQSASKAGLTSHMRKHQ